MTKLLPRRKLLITVYVSASLTIVIILTALFFAFRPVEENYRAGDEVEGITRKLNRDIPDDYPQVLFRDVTSEVGIDFIHFNGRRSTQLPEDMGSGAAWGDYNNDGHLDLYICNIAGPLTSTKEQLESSPFGNRLYRNRGDGTFEDVTSDAGLVLKTISMGAAWGDFDGDDDLDLIVTNFGEIRLFFNKGDGTFEDVSESHGISVFQGFWSGLALGDYDRDGDLDIYVCGYVDYRYDPSDLDKATTQYDATVPFTLNPSSYNPLANLLLRNDTGTFVNIAGELGVENEKGRSLSASWCDLDEDGWPELYVANDISDNVLYKNLDGQAFQDVSHSAWVADYRGAMGLALADWDNDRDIDIFITHWIAQENALYDNTLRMVAGIQSDKSGLQFFDIADQTGLGQIALPYVGWGTSFFDYDNDGLKDIWVVNGSTFQEESQPEKLVPMDMLLFWNRGPEDGFFEIGRVLGGPFGTPLVGRGAAFADYDSDGDIDVFVLVHNGQPKLLRNEGGNNKNWLKVSIVETDHGHEHSGTRIDIFYGDQNQTQVLGAQSSYLSQNSQEAHFGLGTIQRVDRIEIMFLCGEKSVLEDITVNQTIQVRKGSS